MVHHKAVIMVGGDSTGSRFRPLSLHTPGALSPVANQPLLLWHLEACARLPSIKEVFVLGGAPGAYEDFLTSVSDRFDFTVRYLNEGTELLGTAGGLYKFRKEIRNMDPEAVFVMHGDVVGDFPLESMVEFHKKTSAKLTILGREVPKKDSHAYGCLIADKDSGELLHYVEKPETFVSEIVNGGVYVFDPEFFGHLEKIADDLLVGSSANLPLFEMLRRSTHDIGKLANNEVRFSLEQDVIEPLAGGQAKEVFVYIEREGFWTQIKQAGMLLPVNELLLNDVKKRKPEALYKTPEGASGPEIVGNVIIHRNAQVDPSAKIGPNVAIGASAIIGKSARIRDSIILSNVQVAEHAFVSHSIIGWSSVIGAWARVEGVPDYTPTNDSCGVTILGNNVKAAPEIVVRASIVLPHKGIKTSQHQAIIL